MLKACPLCCSIPLTQGKIALVDPWRWVRLNRKGWRAKLSRGGWYAYKIEGSVKKRHYIYMHRLIARTPRDKHCHHRNQNTLDNRDKNFENMKPDAHKDYHKMLRLAKTHGTN